MPSRNRNPAIHLSVDRASDVPLATQLAWRLRTLVATGRLTPGERLPGVREVAETAGVNVNTVRGVYGRLEDEGLIESQHGRGTFISRDAPARTDLGRIAAEAAHSARQAGIDLRDVAAALFVEPATAQAPTRQGDPAPTAAPGLDAPATRASLGDAAERVHRRDLRAQIAHLERELAYAEGLTGEPLAGAGASSGRILATDELEKVRDRLLARLESRHGDLEEIRRNLMATRYAPDAQPGEAREGRRVWRHAGVSTGKRAPGIAHVVWTRGS